jgi:hypothetical protein
MKKIVLLLILLSVTGMTAFAWGYTGHRATGHIASKYLTKKARRAIDRVLSGQSLAIASTWMDEVRADSTYDFMTDWHWVTIPDGMTYDQTEKNPNGDIIMTLQRIINALKSGKLTGKEEVEHLNILVHLVGDIHQPLHVGRPDRGGNSVRVTWFGSNTNLHSVWDSRMIDGTELSYTELAESLDKPTPEQIKSWQGSTVLDWANESMSYRTQIYEIGDSKLGYEYSYKNMNTVRLRLLQGGVRLAGILNEIYG